MAKVRVKLPLGVTYSRPAEASSRCEGATIEQVIKAAIAAEAAPSNPASTRTASFRGRVRQRPQRAPWAASRRPVSDGDVLRVMPPIAGG